MIVRKLAPYLGQYKRNIVLCALCIIAEVLCELTLPLMMAKIVDVGIPAGNIPYMVKTGVLMVLVAMLAILFGVLNAKFSAEASQGFAANLRGAMFRKTQGFSFSNIDRFSSASLVTRMTSDITQLQLTVMMGLRMLARAPIMLVTAFFIAMTINARLSTVIVGAIVVLAVSTALLIKVASKLFAVLQQKVDAVNGTVQENLVAIRVVKAFVRENYERSKFKKVNDDLMNISLKVGAVTSLMMPMMMLVMSATTVSVIWLGGNFVGQGIMNTGELMSFISYIMQILMSVIIFSMVFVMMTRAKACAERAVEVLDTNPDVADRSVTKAVKDARGHIEFKDVSFRYSGDTDDKNVLSNISIAIEPGEFVGIIGSTGSGKTSLVNLIPRFYDATRGQVLVDGVDVRDYTQQQLREMIGMVLQKNNLFTGTIKENLLWGNPGATMEQVIGAAKDAQAHSFIEGLPDGYDTELGQGGVNVSGGQKQRLCIARAMLKKPSILILDDSTSAVDTTTEAKIRQAFHENFRDCTVLIVAQRISSVQTADKIIVMDDGAVAGMGTHEQLMENNEIYREIYHSQTKQGGAA